MFSHIMVGANDIEASKKFYDAVFATLGIEGTLDAKGRPTYIDKGDVFKVTKPLNGEPACGANGGTIGFDVDSPEQGDAWHAAGLSAGGTTCEDAPGIRDFGSFKLYLAYLRDPAGNKLCALKKL
jgi:catechol 2,3-dioxygenase-like lactoylglutathione lyase family enzyme